MYLHTIPAHNSQFNIKPVILQPDQFPLNTVLLVCFPFSGGAGDGAKASGSPLTQWTEVSNHPGLVCALSQNTSNPCVLMVKPSCIQVHELKAPPNKAKVQGMVCLRLPPAGGDPVSLG